MRLRTIAILRGYSPERTLELADQCWEAGMDLVEVPVQDQSGWSALEAVSRAAGGRLLGAGTVLDGAGVERAVSLGAQVIVSPGIVADVVESAHHLGAVALPGVMTPTEVSVAARLGVGTCKLFPATVTGKGWLQALRGPFPGMDFVAVGGVDQANAKEFVAAGATGVAFGSSVAQLIDSGEAADVVKQLHELIDTS